MRVKNIILGIIFMITASGVSAQDLSGLPVSMYDVHDFKIAKGSKHFLGKQEGQFTCWANVLQRVYLVQGEQYSQKEIILNGLMFSKRYQIPEYDYLNFIDTLNATIPREKYLELIADRVTQISSTEIETSIDRNYVIIYLTESHTSFIVGYSKDYYLAVESFEGKFVKVMKSTFHSNMQRIDLPQNMYFTVNPTAPLEVQLARSR